jgi:hypothetical protein
MRTNGSFPIGLQGAFLQTIRKNAQSWTPSTAIPRITPVTFCKPWKDLWESRGAVSHAEQNHSSIVAHLGKGGTLNLAEQVCHLIKRHKSNVLRRQQADYALTITSSNHKSKYSSPIEARDDKNAKKPCPCLLTNNLLNVYSMLAGCSSVRIPMAYTQSGQLTNPKRRQVTKIFTVLPARQDACARKGNKCSSSVATS